MLADGVTAVTVIVWAHPAQVAAAGPAFSALVTNAVSFSGDMVAQALDPQRHHTPQPHDDRERTAAELFHLDDIIGEAGGFHD